MAERTADSSRVRLDHAVLKTTTLEDTAVSLAHLLVAGVGTFISRIKRVGVFHNELAATHQAETGADFITELGLDLVKVNRQLTVGVDRATHDLRDHLFVGGSNAEFGLFAVFQAQQFFAVLLPAPGLFPEIGRTNSGHQNFDSSGLVHLFADDILDLADHL